jgi:hypothetical protein
VKNSGISAGISKGVVGSGLRLAPTFDLSNAKISLFLNSSYLAAHFSMKVKDFSKIIPFHQTYYHLVTIDG